MTLPTTLALSETSAQPKIWMLLGRLRDQKSPDERYEVVATLDKPHDKLPRNHTEHESRAGSATEGYHN